MLVMLVAWIVLQLDLPEAGDETGSSGASTAGQSVPRPPLYSFPFLVCVGPGRGRTTAEADPEWVASGRPPADHTKGPERTSKSFLKQGSEWYISISAECVTFNINVENSYNFY